MSASPYQVLGTGVPRMLGRERLFDRLCGHLTKRSPDHVSVVGPRLFGKSVLLNHLASHFGGLCFVTGSRARLYDLCKDEESRTSNFWQIFHDPPFRVGRFEDEDWHGLLAPFAPRGITVDGSAEKEIRNWTGGVPVLVAALADRLIAGRRGGDAISKADVDRVAGAMADEPLDSVRALWDDCPIELRSALTELSTTGNLRATEVPERRKRELLFRGFAQEFRSGLRSSCGLMAAYTHRRKDEVAYLNLLFGDPDRFDDNVQGMLELRLEGIASGADPKLAGFVRNAIRDLRPDPNGAVVWMRSIANTALDLIWEAELGPLRSLPDSWKSAGIEFEGGRLPRNPGKQCGILRGITGTGQSLRVAKFVTKPTCLLVDHLHSVGNFGQHPEGQRVFPADRRLVLPVGHRTLRKAVRELPT